MSRIGFVVRDRRRRRSDLMTCVISVARSGVRALNDVSDSADYFFVTAPVGSAAAAGLHAVMALHQLGLAAMATPGASGVTGVDLWVSAHFNAGRRFERAFRAQEIDGFGIPSFRCSGCRPDSPEAATFPMLKALHFLTYQLGKAATAPYTIAQKAFAAGQQFEYREFRATDHIGEFVRKLRRSK